MNTIKFITTLTLTLLVAPWTFAGPKEELLRLVPTDSTVCLVIQDFRGHSQRIAKSPFGKSLSQSEWAKAITSGDEWKMLETFHKVMTEHLGISAEELRDDIFGDAIVFAYQPGTGKETRESGLFMLHARDADKLAKLVKKINEAQTNAGEVLELLEKKEGAERYWVRRKSNNTMDAYYLKGNILAYSGQDWAVGKVAQQFAIAPKESAMAKAITNLGFDKAAIACLISPKTVDSELKERIDKAKDADSQAFLSQFVKLWSGLESVGIAVHIDAGIDISIAAHGDPKRIPKEYAWLFESPKASTLWMSVPEDALFAMCGRFDLSKTIEFLKSHLSEGSREKFIKALDEDIGSVIGKDVLPIILNARNVQWGLWITPPGWKAPNQFRTAQDIADSIALARSKNLPAVTLTVQKSLRKAEEEPTYPAVENAIEFLFQAYRVNFNKNNKEQLKIVKHSSGGIGPIQVVSLENDNALPAGVKPSYHLDTRFIRFSTHPDPLLQKFQYPEKAKPEHTGLLMRLSCGKLAKYLQETKMSETVAKLTGKDEPSIRKEFEGLAKIMEHFDTWELRHSVSGSTTSLTWKITPVKSLK